MKTISVMLLDMVQEDRPLRLSSSEFNVLRQLVVRDKYGLEIVADSEGELSRNAIYVLLGRMEDKGMIEGRSEATPAGKTGPPRRIYKISGLGVRALRSNEAALATWRLA